MAVKVDIMYSCETVDGSGRKFVNTISHVIQDGEKSMPFVRLVHSLVSAACDGDYQIARIETFDVDGDD